MLTFRRFRALADSYGADLRRWPEKARGDAQALLDVSAEARALLDEVRRLDQVIEEASAREDSVLGQAGDPAAALARLRAGVEARIASSARPQPMRRPFAGLLARVREAVLLPDLRRAGVMAAGGIALIAGLWVGGMHTTTPAAGTMLTLLQPAPLSVLAE